MIAIDTNVLLRTWIDDDPEQCQLARDLIRDARDRGEACLITNVVLCETEWVIESVFGGGRDDVLEVIRRLLANAVFVFENRDELALAADRYAESRADLSDLLIGCKGSGLGASTIYTFDRALRDQPGFTLLR